MREREQKWCLGRSELLVTEVAPDVLLCKLIGFHEDQDIVLQFSRWFDARTDGGRRVHMFWDTEETKGYKTECREALQEWQRRARPRMASSTVLVRSKLMEMALSITNLITGSFHKATNDRRKFETMLAAATREAIGPRRA
jgi:hypothetical protein